ncbi:MAG: polysaccharide deacetylase family protein [Bacteroidetes bacterium]|nr:polysaccharide deacetylase family protein [Bacteroidota bacterium]MBS1755857.1 polysaccharide deacetylase family protein [Bacteroidota bacterium]
MNTGPGSYFGSSTFFKTSVITLTFSSIYFYKSDKPLAFLKQPVVKDDSIAVVKTPPVITARKKKTIYLTFDDGPNKGTQKVMDILNAEKIPATLFIVGQHVYGSREQRSIYDSLLNNNLIEIANHSYTHAFENKFAKFYSFENDAVNDFTRCADSLHLSDNIVRLPGRNIWRTKNLSITDIKNSTATADSLQKKGYTAMGWDLEWHFTNNQNLVQSDTLLLSQIDSAFAHNRTRTPNQLVLLAHDRTFWSPADSSALHRLVQVLKQRDEYNFETINKYPGIAN